MNILALDTSMGACGAAVLRSGGAGPRAIAREEKMVRGHAEALMPMVAEVMQEAQLGFDQLDLIAATLGPGSFTGVRIAIAAARGLALVTPAKLWGTDSLSVMAKTALMGGAIEDEQPFAVAVDARASSLYFGLYDGNGARRLGPLLASRDEAAAMLPDDVRLAIGSGAMHLAEAALARGKPIEARLPELQPSALALAELALEAGKTLASLRPLYLRPPDARPQTNAGVARR